jgi:predicted phosphodiesterase
MGSHWEPFVVASDIHGDEQDVAANKVFFDFVKIWKPKYRICAGDLWNFASLRGKASEEERRLSLQDDYDKGLDWFTKFNPNVFLRGNHDERLWLKAEAKNGPVSDLALKCIAEFEMARAKTACKLMLPYHKRDGIYRLGESHLKVLHGFATGIHAAQKHAQVYGSCLFGHVHSIQQFSPPSLENNATHLASLIHRHGWAYGFVHSRIGAYQVYQAENIGDGKWLLPTGIREF